VIDISHNVRVSDFGAVRRSGIMAVIHKVTEGGDWFDPSYASRRVEAERAGLLWGGYHFGTRQYPGAKQAMAFLSAVQPGPKTVLALDIEPNDRNPGNTMRVQQAEEFVRVIQQQTGRLPLVYIHPGWANGQVMGRRRLRIDRPITTDSILARCDLWVADYREQPEVPDAWGRRGWKLWQYVADESTTPPMAPRRAPFRASPTATAICSTAMPRRSPATGALGDKPASKDALSSSRPIRPAGRGFPTSS
jgi:lysozyme